MAFAFVRSGLAAVPPALMLMLACVSIAPAQIKSDQINPQQFKSKPIKIVAIGASNTSGWGVHSHHTYPAKLQAMLKSKGYKAAVTNAGVVFDTTAKMLRRIDYSVPAGTDIVILQPGGNDLRFFGTRAQRAANIEAMVKRLRDRRIKIIVFDPIIPPQYYQFDGIHITARGHEMFATELLPQVIAAIEAAPG